MMSKIVFKFVLILSESEEGLIFMMIPYEPGVRGDQWTVAKLKI